MVNKVSHVGLVLCVCFTSPSASRQVAAQLAWDAPREPWASRGQAGDQVRQHVERIDANRHEYTVVHGGTMDGQNCRSPFGVFEGVEWRWESNRAVRIENTGDGKVVNPWLSNGRNNFRNLQEIVAAAVAPGMSDREKALALWYQEVTHRYHWMGDNRELGDPVRVFNVYGHNTCGNDSICLAGLWRAAGLRVAPARPLTHCISQVFFDGRWHLLDGDMQNLYLLRDNRTIADEQDLVHDHDLVKRTHTHGILHPNSRRQDEQHASIFVYEGPVKGDRRCRTGTNMDMVLRPGEALVYRWGHVEPIKFHGPEAPRFPDAICNGLWEYQPDVSRTRWREDAESVEHVRATGDGLAAEAGRTGCIVWKMRAPYPFVGGRFELRGRGSVSVSLSKDGETWTDVSNGVLDYQFPSEWGPFYEYRLRCQLRGAARLQALKIQNDMQMAPLGMPGMTVGENRFVYTDASPGERSVRITHVWVERSVSRPPRAPDEPVFPPDRSETEGTAIVFQWLPPNDPDGDAIVDYHWQLSDRSDMRWPLSPNFRKLISRTPDAGKPQYRLPYVGLLTPDRTYYWRVRAKDSQGAWGPWSRIWSFTPRGPAPPRAVTLDYDAQSATGTLRWKPHSVGRAPVRYRVYASDEKGFSISDTAYAVNTGKTESLRSPFPANFAAETANTSLVVVGRGLDAPGANKAYYRVVAVDAQGNRSGCSTYVTAPRPLIHSVPVTTARVGQPYRYQAASIRSLGDARHRGDQGMGFWDIERPRFQLRRGPDWLELDAASGLLTGTPDAAGEVTVILTAVIDREVPELDEQALSWGNYKELGVRNRRVGATTQEFVIWVSER